MTTGNAMLEMLQDVSKWQKTATKSRLCAADTALQQSKVIMLAQTAEKKGGEHFINGRKRLTKDAGRTAGNYKAAKQVDC